MPQIIERGPQGQIVASAPTPPPQGNQNTPTETPPTQPPGKQPEKTEQKSPELQRLEALARRERLLRQQAQQKLQRQDQSETLQKEIQTLRQQNQQFQQMYQRFLRDPVSILNEAGIPSDVITQSMLNAPSREAVSIRQLSLQNRQLMQEIENLKKGIETDRKTSLDTTKAQIKADVKSLVDDTTSPYEAIKANGSEAVEAVSLLIEQTLEKEGRLLTVKEAADQVENYLIDEAAKLAGLNKVKEKLGASQAQTTTGAPGVNTLSNRSIPAPQTRTRMSDRDRIARAVAAFEAAKAERATQ